MKSELALFGGRPVVSRPRPHFRWPPEIPELPEVFADYVRSGGPLSIPDRSGVVRELEEEFSARLGRKYALLTSSGTMALYSAFYAVGVEQGEEVVSTVYSFHATASPLLHLGARVVFCDVEPDTGNVDPQALAELVGPQTRAVVTNDMWGHPVDKEAVAAICRQHGVAWVEDCSHAHFAEYRGRFVGTFGDVAVFSLQGNKLLTGGEGGILVTDDEEIYRRAVLVGQSLGRTKEAVQGTAWEPLGRTGLGLKFRVHPLAAVMVLHLLRNHCERWIRLRGETLAYFSERLAGLEGIQPMARREYVTSMGAHYGFKPRVDFQRLGVSRDTLVRALRAEGLDVKAPGSPPFHHLALFDPERFPVNRFPKVDWRGRQFPGAEAYYASILSLPTFTFPEDRPLIDDYVRAFEKVLSRIDDLRHYEAGR